MNICKTCGCEHDGSYGSGIFCSKHCRYVYIGKQTKNHVCNWPKKQTAPYGTWKCRYCNAVFETKAKLTQHKHQFHAITSVWNKGLTKETDETVLHASLKLKEGYTSGKYINPFKGKHWSKEDRQRISQQRRNYLKLHPDQIPYLLSHSSKMSYPEQCFQRIIDQYQLDLKYHLQINIYQLDFYNEEHKKYIEIDGEQHYINNQLIERDIIRTDFLLALGWSGMRIRWKNFLALSSDQQKQKINEIKQFIMS